LSRATDIVLYMLCLNAAIAILNGAGIVTLGPTSSSGMNFNPATLLATAVGAVGSMVINNASLLFVFVAWGALSVVFAPIGLIITGFPDFLTSLGAPSWLMYPLYTVYAFVIALWIIHLMTGRSTGDEG